MNNSINPDQALREQLSGSADERKLALQQIFRSNDLRTMTFSYILKHGGKEEDCRDVFQEVFLLFERAVREKKFEGKSSVSTFFIGIVKWHWINTLRKRGAYTALDDRTDFMDTSDSVEASVIDEEKRKLLHSVIGQMNERCRQLLRLWGLSMSPEEIAKEAGLAGPDMAKKETYRCRAKLKEFFDARPHLMEALKN